MLRKDWALWSHTIRARLGDPRKAVVSCLLDFVSCLVLVLLEVAWLDDSPARDPR